MTGKPFEQEFTQVSVEELGQRLSSQEPDLQLVDVREPQEVAIASIDGFVNLPLSQFANWGSKFKLS